MALPEFPLTDLLQSAHLVLVGRVTRIVEQRDDAPPPDPREPGWVGPMDAESSQLVELGVREVLDGAWDGMTLLASKPLAPYTLVAQSPWYELTARSHLFLLRWRDSAGRAGAGAISRQLGGLGRGPHGGEPPEILGLYGPEEIDPKKCLELLGHAGFPDCHAHPRRPRGLLEGAAWVRDPPAPWECSDERRPQRERISLHCDADDTVLLRTHVGDATASDMARFDSVQSAQSFVSSLLERTQRASGMAPASDGLSA